jgi:hypothetical protein
VRYTTSAEFSSLGADAMSGSPLASAMLDEGQRTATKSTCACKVHTRCYQWQRWEAKYTLVKCMRELCQLSGPMIARTNIPGNQFLGIFVTVYYYDKMKTGQPAIAGPPVGWNRKAGRCGWASNGSATQRLSVLCYGPFLIREIRCRPLGLASRVGIIVAHRTVSAIRQAQSPRPGGRHAQGGALILICPRAEESRSVSCVCSSNTRARVSHMSYDVLACLLAYSLTLSKFINSVSIRSDRPEYTCLATRNRK